MATGSIVLHAAGVALNAVAALGALYVAKTLVVDIAARDIRAAGGVGAWLRDPGNPLLGAIALVVTAVLLAAPALGFWLVVAGHLAGAIVAAVVGLAAAAGTFYLLTPAFRP